MGAIIPFPPTVRPSDSLAAILDRAASLAWSDQQSQMAGVAREMVAQPTSEIRIRVDRIVAAEGDGLLRETVAALSATADEYRQAALAIDAARDRLAALVASARPSGPPLLDATRSGGRDA